MTLNRFGQSLEIITAFQATNYAAVAMHLGDIEDALRQSHEVRRLQTQRSHRIFPVSVEAGADQHQLWPYFFGNGLQRVSEPGKVFLPRCAKRQWHVERRA